MIQVAPIEDQSAPSLQKADPWVLRKLESGASAEFFVVLHDKADLSGAAKLHDKNAKGRLVFETLRAVAERTQRTLRAWLSAPGIAHRAFWNANMVLVRGDAALARELAARDDIATLAAKAASTRTSCTPWWRMCAPRALNSRYDQELQAQGT